MTLIYNRSLHRWTRMGKVVPKLIVGADLEVLFLGESGEISQEITIQYQT